jgi:hypothetical protein
LEKWNERSQVSKLAWYWAVLNERILNQFVQIPKENYIIQCLEDLNYDKYKTLIDFLGSAATVPQRVFDKIATTKPNSRKNKPTTNSWTKSDKEYFKEIATPVANGFGYNIEEILKR